ncbi:MAG: hypothetical protein WB780_08470 [Candidatus Acidiferrales bacterium]
MGASGGECVYLMELSEKLAARRRFVFVAGILFLLLGLVGGSARASGDAHGSAAASLGPSAQFAIEDFDGDLRPDIASIQAGQSGLPRTDYWIQLELSAAGRQFIRVAGPAGGLEIEARDVNGDRAIDLVLVTAWRRQPVAILLNDGHGVFSRVEPAAFPEAFGEPAVNWAGVSGQAMDAVGAPPQPGAGIGAAESARTAAASQADSIPRLSAGFLFDHFAVSHAGRAPPK